MDMTRRNFFRLGVAATAATLAPRMMFADESQSTPKPNEAHMSFTLPPLPYAENALEPSISAKTLSFHHGKHHKAYVDKLNELIKGTDLEKLSLEDIIRKTAGDTAKATTFNNAAQVWNHTFYWNSMKPGGGGAPKGALAQKIEKELGGFEGFKEAFKNAGATQFGSGWAWLVSEKGVLKVTKTPNSDLPLVHGQTALLTMDVWEHAYYLDYQNKRPDYISTFLDKLVNWDFAEQNLLKASA